MTNKFIYLDNASNCRMRKEVIKLYKKILVKKNYSNPLSFHTYGRKSKNYIEISREKISNIINCDPSEIFFTSGGTEGNIFIIKYIVKYLNIKYIITSKLEHLSVLNTIISIKKKKKIKVFFIKNNNLGILNLKHLYKILKKIKKKKKNILVSIMYVNNEIGNINDINKIGYICKKNNSFFHSDLVQFIGHFKLNVKNLLCDFFTSSAHKFYGPLGIGFIYIKKNINDKLNLNKINNIILENKNLYGILGLYKALEISNNLFLKEKKKILKLKKYCIFLLKKNFFNIKFNGLSNNLKKSSFYILNIRLPIIDDLLHIKLDLKNIMISKSSSCNFINQSHVLKNILNKKSIRNTTSIRISFSIFNNIIDIELFIYELKKIIYNNSNYLIKIN
ncbi:MAG: aminotransferase class V-fold PLP-dependent enzyme [Candidatus Shikimatogenerans bostrichidophilus]|nr:MAG: aminotransferase class V-fold PLP-dependent enzyme [Candidatus Shikimatogenerans bostrichidophilus]